MNSYLHIDKLIHFYTVCELMNFSHAAEKLGVAQSTISRNMASLEKELNVVLFERTTRSTKLTHKGQEVLTHVKRILKDIKGLEMYAKNSDSLNSGILKVIGGENSLGTLSLEDIEGFYKENPNITLDIATSNKMPLFLKDDFKVGVVASINDQQNIVQKYLMTFYLGMFASRDYLERFGTPRKPSDLDKHRLIIFENHDIPFAYSENWALELGTKRKGSRTPYLIINSAPMSFMAAKKGLGIAVLSKESVYHEGANLVEVLADYPGPILKVYYTYHDSYEGNALINSFEAYLRGVIKKNSWS